MTYGGAPGMTYGGGGGREGGVNWPGAGQELLRGSPTIVVQTLGTEPCQACLNKVVQQIAAGQQNGTIRAFPVTQTPVPRA
jgi:hypothetical protein